MMPSSDNDDLDTMSNDQLLDEVTKGILDIERRLIRTAAAWRRLEERGDVRAREICKRWIGKCIAAVAHGKLHPAVPERFGWCGAKLNAVKTLSMAMQERLAKGEAVPIAELTPSGEPTHRMVPVDLLTDYQVAMVFDTKVGRIRSVQEQHLFLADRTTRVLSEPDEPQGRVKIDKRSRTVRVDGEVGIDHLIRKIKAAGFNL